MTVEVGPFQVGGPEDAPAPPRRVNWVRSALASLDPDVDPKLLLPTALPLTFGPVGKVPGYDYDAAGYTRRGPLRLEVRHDDPDSRDLSRETTEYVVLHEGFGHARMVQRPISRKNWRALKRLVKGPVGATYWHDVTEVLIDAAVEAISGVVSPYKHEPARPNARNRYRRWVDEADLPEVKRLWLADATPLPTPDPEPVPDPPPTPDPVDPRDAQIAQLTTERDQAKTSRDTAIEERNLATAAAADAESRLEQAIKNAEATVALGKA